MAREGGSGANLPNLGEYARDFNELDFIGNGRFGRVYRVQLKKTGMIIICRLCVYRRVQRGNLRYSFWPTISATPKILSATATPEFEVP